MRRLLLFNPSNDMALAVNSLEYLPPLHIQRMESDLAILPLWWAEEDDCVLMPDNTLRCVNARVLGSLQEACSNRSLDGQSLSNIVASMPVVEAQSLVPAPWGWSNALRRRLLRIGIRPEVMPGESELNDYRQLSSRAFACEYIHELLSDAGCMGISSSLVGQGMRMVGDASVFSCDSQAVTCKSSLIFKTPWSSSGRGVWVTRPCESIDTKRIQRTIRQQGHVMVDDFYEDKILDFALEFEVNAAEFALGKDGGVRFLGYSVFCASDSGNYGYNVVAPQEELRARILATGLDPYVLDWAVDYSCRNLARHLCGRYRGCVGIDMLVCNHEGKVKLHPCVEINLRRNMGILALDISRHIRLSDDKLPPVDMVLAGSESQGFSAKLRGEQLYIDSGF